MQYDADGIKEATGNAEDAIARREGESVKAHNALLCYVDLPTGQRSMAAAYRAYRGKDGAEQGEQEARSAPTYFALWSAEWDWVERADKYDFHFAEVARARRAEQQFSDIEAYRERVKKTSVAKFTFFQRIHNLVNRRLTECEQQDLRSATETAAIQQAHLDAELAGEPLHKPPQRPCLPTPVSEYESLIRTYARASAVASGGLVAEAEGIGLNAIAEELNRSRKREEEL